MDLGRSKGHRGQSALPPPVPMAGGAQWGSSPDHGEEDGAAADEIHQEEDFLPDTVVTGALLTGLDDNVGHVGQDLQGGGRDRWAGALGLYSHAHRLHPWGLPRHLQWDHYPEDLLLLVRQHVLDEGPAGADQSDGDEEEGTLQPGGGR